MDVTVQRLCAPELPAWGLPIEEIQVDALDRVMGAGDALAARPVVTGGPNPSGLGDRSRGPAKRVVIIDDAGSLVKVSFQVAGITVSHLEVPLMATCYKCGAPIEFRKIDGITRPMHFTTPCTSK